MSREAWQPNAQERPIVSRAYYLSLNVLTVDGPRTKAEYVAALRIAADMLEAADIIKERPYRDGDWLSPDSEAHLATPKRKRK